MSAQSVDVSHWALDDMDLNLYSIAHHVRLMGNGNTCNSLISQIVWIGDANWLHLDWIYNRAGRRQLMQPSLISFVHAWLRVLRTRRSIHLPWAYSRTPQSWRSTLHCSVTVLAKGRSSSLKESNLWLVRQRGWQNMGTQSLSLPLVYSWYQPNICLSTASPGNEVSKPHKAPTSIPTGSMESQRRKTKRIPTTLDTVSESSSRRSTMEEPSVPVGSKFGEKKAPERKEIPPLNGASDEGSRLPSLGQGPIGDGRSESLA